MLNKDAKFSMEEIINICHEGSNHWEDAKILMEEIIDNSYEGNDWEEIIDNSYEGNDWEEKFLASICDRIDEGNDLTEGQGLKLEEIYRKASKKQYG